MNDVLRFGISTGALALIACSSASSGGPSAPGGDGGGGGPTDAAAAAVDAPGGFDAGVLEAASVDGGTLDAPSAGGADVKLVLDVPAAYTGAAREIDVVVVPQLPVAGPPAAILYQQKSPTVTAGAPWTIHGDATGVSGQYYVVVALYMQGGGSFSPKAGVDYVAESSAKVAFGGGPVDLGTMKLVLAGGDGGP
jgi:hypothetical protein